MLIFLKSTLDYSMESCATYFIIIIIINAITITTTITSAIAIVSVVHVGCESIHVHSWN